jgi:maltose alpha-D-glucosyltransferase/alpha-amylase
LQPDPADSNVAPGYPLSSEAEAAVQP